MSNYIPKSNIKISNTGNKKFVYVSNKISYTGYYIETAEGKYFAGRDPLLLTQEIIPFEDIAPKTSNDNIPTPDKVATFSKNTNSKKHQALSSGTYLNLKDKKTIISTKNIPTDLDFQKGYFNRFFVNRINDVYFYEEINKKTYESILANEDKYDYKLYKVGKLKWALAGNTADKNIKQINLVSKLYDFPFLYTLFPILNEFSEPKIINNQYANPGELFYKDNPSVEYIGPYHVHPEKGPMEGATHSETPHAELIFATGSLTSTPTPITLSMDSENFETYQDTGNVNVGGTTYSGGGTSGGGGGGY